VGVRIRATVLLAAVAATSSCGRGTRQPGSPFAGAALLAPLSDAEEAHDALLRADLGRADSVARRGYADGLSSTFTDDVVYLRGGLPIVRGRPAASAIIAAESLGVHAAVRWQPVRAEASLDGKSGYSYGYSVYSAAQPTSTSVRIDRYIAFWRRGAGGWRIAGYAETYGTPPAALSLPLAARGSALKDLPMPRATGALEAIRSADSDFSRDAGWLGTGEAFGRYAAEDAQIFSGPGEFISGPRAITQSFGTTTTKNSLVWHPVHGEVSEAGDLGFTVGNAMFTGHREDGAPVVLYSKYLTVWKKQRDGSWRYVVDGGSARPND
jgi:ketosteroid isomerase-like protein